MPNFRVHIYTGIFSYPAFLMACLFGLQSMGYSPYLQPGIIGTGYLIYILGSDFPDVDSQSSLINRFVQVLVTGTVAGVFYSFFLSRSFQKVLSDLTGIESVATALTFSIAILAGIAGSKLLSLLDHRGFLHTIWAALIFGGAIFGLVFPGSDFSAPGNTLRKTEAIYLSLSGFGGYCLHIILDKVNTFFKTRFVLSRKKRVTPGEN